MRARAAARPSPAPITTTSPAASRRKARGSPRRSRGRVRVRWRCPARPRASSTPTLAATMPAYPLDHAATDQGSVPSAVSIPEPAVATKQARARRLKRGAATWSAARSRRRWSSRPARPPVHSSAATTCTTMPLCTSSLSPAAWPSRPRTAASSRARTSRACVPRRVVATGMLAAITPVSTAPIRGSSRLDWSSQPCSTARSRSRNGTPARSHASRTAASSAVAVHVHAATAAARRARIAVGEPGGTRAPATSSAPTVSTDASSVAASAARRPQPTTGPGSASPAGAGEGAPPASSRAAPQATPAATTPTSSATPEVVRRRADRSVSSTPSGSGAVVGKCSGIRRREPGRQCPRLGSQPVPPGPSRGMHQRSTTPCAPRRARPPPSPP